MIIIYNAPFTAAVLGWLIAQCLKMLGYFYRYRKFSLDRFLGAGGMPSSHSAAVCGLCSAIAVREGLGSSIFALSAVLAMVVMYDASGIRRAAGMHAREINRIRDIMEDLDLGPGLGVDKPEDIRFEEEMKQLKEILGHSPLEVFLGALLGIAVGIITAMLT